MEKKHPRHLMHERIKKKHPKAVKKAKRLFNFKYPKLAILILAIIFACYIFKNPIIILEISRLKEFGYLGVLIAGMLLSFGFSAPFAIGFLIISNPPNIFLASLIGGLGAALGDLIIFKTIKFSFMNEIKELEKSKTIKEIKKIVDKNISIKIRHYFLYLFAGIFIVSPLPDEVGVSMLAGLTTINQKIFAIVSFVLHTIAIFLILLASM
jgi:hypothetical protein